MRHFSKVSAARVRTSTMALVVLGAVGIVGTASPGASALPTPSCVAFDSSGSTGVMSCIVPAGTTVLRVIANGAGGGGAGGRAGDITSGAGGSGAKVTYDLAVTPGDTLTLEVGTGGASAGTGQDGAGGGGWTAVKNGATILLVAAGGGGAGSAASSGVTVSGGSASSGGTANGSDGSSSIAALLPGKGATATAAGDGGLCTSGCGGPMYNGGNGSSGAGGNGSDVLNPNKAGKGGAGWQGGAAGNSGMFGTGGGGGSGYFGGGGGSSRWFELGAGGGAGSSYPATGATYETAGNGGAVNTAGGKGSITLNAVPAPTVTAVSPTTGSAAGGTTITITGTNFASGATVTIGGQPATNVTWVSATQITVTTPAGTAGTADVVVTNPDTQTGTGRAIFTYAAASTQVGPIAPNSGLKAGSGLVTLDNVQVPVTITTAGRSIVMTGSGFEMRLTGYDENKTSGRLDAQGRLILQSGGFTRVSGEGFAPDSDVEVYLFSDPVSLGTARTDSSGAFSKLFGIPADTPSGVHTIQANGLTTDGKVRSLNLGVIVPAPADDAGALPETGASPWSLLLLALMTLALGGLLGASRRAPKVLRPRP